MNTCEIHGAFESKFIELLGTRIEQKGCPRCNEIEQAEKERQEMAMRVERSVRARIERRLSAGISERNCGKSFSEWHTEGPEQHHALDIAKAFAANVINGGSGNLIICGSVGTGKTLLASAICEAVIAKKTCRMIRVIDLVRKIKETWARGSDISEQQVIDQFASVDLLVLDEVGIQFGTDTEKLFMFDVIDLRYQRNLPTVLISNLAVEDIANAVGSRVVDRLRENGGKYIAMKWDSKRK